MGAAGETGQCSSTGSQGVSANSSTCQTEEAAALSSCTLCPLFPNAVCFCFFFFFSLLHVCNISSWLKKLFSFCGNMKALHYSALIPHGWRSMASLKSFPAVCSINSCTKTKLISFSEISLLTLNKVRGMGRNSSNNSLHDSREITSQTPGPNSTDHFCPLLQGMQRMLEWTGPHWSAPNPKSWVLVSHSQEPSVSDIHVSMLAEDFRKS